MCQKYIAGLIDQQTTSAFYSKRQYISEHAQEPQSCHQSIATERRGDWWFLTIKKAIICLFAFSLIFLLSPASEALKIKCNDDGSIQIKDSSKRGVVSAKQKGTDDPYIKLPGRWTMKKVGKKTYYNFLSKEAQFIVGKPTKFYIKTGRKSRRSVTCPTFKFSCLALNSTVESCYKRNNTFVAKFLIYNIPLRSKKQTFRFGSPFTLKYTLHTGTRKLTHSPTAYSPEFKDINMTLKKLKGRNKYTLSTYNVTQEIDRFSVSYHCERSIFHAGKECTEMPSCRYDGDCMQDEFCKDDICEKVDCDDCQYTEEHECVDYACCENVDCGNEEFCEENTCKELNCSQEESIIDHSCSLLTCASDEHTVNHECVKMECEEHEHAVEHECELLKCEYNEQIVDHKCEKFECKFYQKAFDHDCLNLVEYVFAER